MNYKQRYVAYRHNERVRRNTFLPTHALFHLGQLFLSFHRSHQAREFGQRDDDQPQGQRQGRGEHVA